MTRALLYCAGGGIGDSLVASVVGRALHAHFEQVDALTLPGHRSTLERVPDLDGVLVDDGGDESALAASLQERRYDACVVTWATARTARIPKLARIIFRATGAAATAPYPAFSTRTAIAIDAGSPGRAA